MQIPAIPITRWQQNADGYIYRDGYVGFGNFSGATNPGGVIGIDNASTWIGRDATGNMVFTDINSGEQTLASLIGGGGGSGGSASRATAITQEDFTISVDPAGSGGSGTPVLLNQAESDAYGDFHTVEAALDSIPDHVQHIVTISVATGTMALNATDPLGDFRRFVFMSNGSSSGEAGFIKFTSAAGLIIEPNTTTMDVTSGSGTSLVLDSDPGFADDAYKGAFLEVVEGTGIGQIRGIRAHSGTAFTIPPQWSPSLDATSKVEIRKPAANLTFTPTTDIQMLGTGGFMPSTAQMGGLEFNEIDLSHATTGCTINFTNMSVTFGSGARAIGITLGTQNSDLRMKSCIIDGKSTRANGVVLSTGFLRTQSSSEAWLILDYTNVGIMLLGSNAGAQTFLFNGTINGCLRGILSLGPRSNVHIGQLVDGVNTNYGVQISQGGAMRVDADTGSPPTITGGTADFLLDDIDVVSYADVLEYNVIVGSVNQSRIMIA